MAKAQKQVLKKQFEPADTKRRIQKHRIAMFRSDPVTAAILMELRLDEVDHGTFATDGFRLRYNPEFAQYLTEKQLESVLVHEACHVMLLHPFRRGKRKPMLANIAMDMAINSIIQDAGYQLPDGAVFPEREFWHDSFEQHYKRMEQNGQGAGVQIIFVDEKGNEIARGMLDGDVLEPCDANGKPLDDKQKREMEEKITGIVEQAVTRAGHSKGLSSVIKRHIDAANNYVMDWKARLREFVQKSIVYYEDWCRPNRRLQAHGYVMPSIKVPDDDKLSFIVNVDTSGSIGDEVLGAFQSELNAICQEFSLDKVWVVYFSSIVHKVVEQDGGENVILKSKWTGGTDFDPPMKENDRIMEENHGCKFVLFFTDLEVGDFPDERQYPVLWCNYNHGDKDKQAPWGTTIPITP